MPFTLVSFHAHPDDEVLLTGGTLARAAAEGHRVVLVVATNGESGPAPARVGDLAAPGDLGAVRVVELHRAAAALGVVRVVMLGYPDSGMRADDAPVGAFCRLAVEEPARRLAEILVEERADALTVYDSAGGYGHPDHRQVHTVGVLAARLAGTPLVLEATLDRTLLRRLVAMLRLIPFRWGEVSYESLARAYSPRAAITHRVDVRAHLPAKLRALREHASQATGGRGPRTAGLLLRLPGPVARLLLGTEYFVQRGWTAGPVRDDIFAGLGDGPEQPTDPAAR